MKDESEHLFRITRFVFPFILPIWMIAYPIWCHKDEFGTFFQSEEDRTFNPPGSGLWSNDVCIVFILSSSGLLPFRASVD